MADQSIRILAVFKKQFIKFLDELIAQFPREPDLVIVRIFMKDQVPVADVMCHIICEVLPHEEAISQRKEDFFIKETNALLFVCESSDTKGLVRERLFERWYRIAPCPYIDKFDETVQDSELGIEYITSLLVHAKAPYKNLLLKEYKNLSLFYSK